jgi:hypothetical protein
VRCDDGVFVREPLARSGADRLLYQPLSHGDCRTHVFTSDGSALGRDLSRRIAAAASFDGGDLATVSELSPHLLAPKMKGRIYVAGADKGNSYLKEMAERLEKTLSDAGEVDHRCDAPTGSTRAWSQPCVTSVARAEEYLRASGLAVGAKRQST